jgi:hypothetical protein
MKYLGNTLQRDFQVPPEHHDDFSRVFRENTKYLGIKSGDAPASNEKTKGPSTVLIGEPATKSKLKAFVIMPFTEKSLERPKGFFEEVFRSLITPAGLDAASMLRPQTGKGAT